MASDGGTNRPLPSLILLGIVDFVCILMAAESYRDRQFFAGAIWLVAGIASSVIGYYWPQVKSWLLKSSAPDAATSRLPVETNNKPPTLFDLFKRDFPVMKSSDNEPAITIGWHDGTETKISRQVYMDFPARTKFAGFYIPVCKSADMMSGQKTFSACLKLAEIDAVQAAFEHVSKNVGIQMGQNEQMTNMQELTFSGRVLIYHEEHLSIQQKAEILNVFAVKNQAVTFMGSDYLGTQVIAWHHQHDPKPLSQVTEK